jgi:PAS domain S-box-containing protein
VGYIALIARFTISTGREIYMSTGPQRHDGVTLPDEFDTLRVGTVLHDPETGAILDANPQLEELYGYPAETLREMRFEAISANTYPETQAAVDRRIAAAAEGTPQSFEWRIKRADGRLIWVSINLTRIRIEGQPYVLGEVADITEYKHNDRRVRLFYRLLRHNLRNDINVITGFADHVESVAETEAAATAAGKIKTAATNLSRVSESVKQIETTITHDQSHWSRRAAVDVVTDTVEGFDPGEAAQHIDIDEQAQMWIAVDNAFDHALTHAIENAIVHAETPEPSVRIVVDESPNTGRVEIRIEDECPPIPEMELAALDEYTETTTTSHGSGVGLFVMKWCIESLGGELKIERRRGRGNTVYFYLPPKESTETTVNSEAATEPETAANSEATGESEAVVDTARRPTDSVSPQRSTE